ncbi:Beta-ketoadipate enol-lactone hydrolase [Labilithrix luteola]|uniref:Beta-ketoadipate enol-lactone hydrolase n=1 Tax=Labilithrix luteola TaxID=1391654 RepID=A0A0K1PPZ1_9BACT|nr:alpha/beta fold hydrolase [Labilithrix luteola]AKU95610.1 Beta-ketoadipate enol-lactone hydrolase [Labilithrix luteola]
MPFYDAQGRGNYFIEFGKGPPVLLLHGISNSGRAWAPQIPSLVAAGYRVIVPDHAGHGASARLSAPFGVADLADDIESLLAHLRIETLDLVGLSLGGMVALELALRHPARIGRLVVANSFDKTATPPFQAMAKGWAETFERPHGPVARLEQSWPSLVSPAFQATPDGLRTYQIWHGIAATADGASLAHVARGIGNFDVSARIGQLVMPTLFIAGSLDAMSPPEMSRHMAERVPRARCVVIDGAAHISNVDSAEVFSSRLVDFLHAAQKSTAIAIA